MDLFTYLVPLAAAVVAVAIGLAARQWWRRRLWRRDALRRLAPRRPADAHDGIGA